MPAIQDVTILAMASLAETRDNETGNHIRRTQNYVQALAEQLQDHPRFAHVLDDATIDLLFKSAPLHDIGKVGIPDRILLKPGQLHAGRVRDHEDPHHARAATPSQHAEDALGMQVDFLQLRQGDRHWHQEKWDGSGYPDRAWPATTSRFRRA